MMKKPQFFASLTCCLLGSSPIINAQVLLRHPFSPPSVAPELDQEVPFDQGPMAYLGWTHVEGGRQCRMGANVIPALWLVETNPPYEVDVPLFEGNWLRYRQPVNQPDGECTYLGFVGRSATTDRFYIQWKGQGLTSEDRDTADIVVEISVLNDFQRESDVLPPGEGDAVLTEALLADHEVMALRFDDAGVSVLGGVVDDSGRIIPGGWNRVISNPDVLRFPHLVTVLIDSFRKQYAWQISWQNSEIDDGTVPNPPINGSGALRLEQGLGRPTMVLKGFQYTNEQVRYIDGFCQRDRDRDGFCNEFESDDLDPGVLSGTDDVTEKIGYGVDDILIFGLPNGATGRRIPDSDCPRDGLSGFDVGWGAQISAFCADPFKQN